MTKASNVEAPKPSVELPLRPATAPAVRAGSNHSLWLWVAAGFVFLGLLWTGMFMASRQADTRTVPLATRGGG